MASTNVRSTLTLGGILQDRTCSMYSWPWPESRLGGVPVTSLFLLRGNNGEFRERQGANESCGKA